MSMYREFMLNCLTWEDQTRLKNPVNRFNPRHCNFFYNAVNTGVM